MDTMPFPDNNDVLLSIQNSKKPDQTIFLVWDRSNKRFVTQGLNRLFGVKEIRLDSLDILDSLPEYAQVLSFLLESMSTAQDLNLPYSYQNEFYVGNIGYTLHSDADYRVLKRKDAAPPSL